MAKNYNELAGKIIDLVGGAENISFSAHCITRLRFNLKDKGLLKKEAIEKLPGVMGSTWAGDQYQIIIGTEVKSVYDAVCEAGGLRKEKGVDEDLGDSKPAAKKKFNPFSALLDMISGSFVPVLPVIIACGNVTVLLIILNMFHLIDPASSTYQILSNVADTGFYFMPIFVGGYAAKKLNCIPALGMLVGAVLIHPGTMSLISSGEASILGLSIHAASYASTVFPVIVVVWVMSYIEKFFAKISPKALRSLIEPFGTLLVILPLELLLLAPMGAVIGEYLIAGIMWIKDSFGAIGVGVLGSMYPIFFLTGMNSAIVSYLVGAFAATGTEPFLIAVATVYGKGLLGATLAIAIKTRDSDVKSKAIATSITNLVGGITEPSLFGVIVQRKYALFSSMAGLFCGCIVVGLTSTVAHAFPAGAGFLTYMVFVSESGIGDLINVIIANVVALVVAFVLTYITFDKDKVNH